MGVIQNIRNVFFAGANAKPQNAPIVGSVAPTTHASTFDNKNFTFSGDLKNYDYDSILRNKQKNINELYALADYYVDKDPIFRGIIKGVYTPFSVSDWKLVGANEATKKKYEQYYQQIHLRDLMWSIFYQNYKYENVYLYLMPDGSLITLPPYKVRISNIVRNGEPVIEYNSGSVTTDLDMKGVKAKKKWAEDDDLQVRLAGYPPEVEDAVKQKAAWVQLNPDNTFVLQGIKEDWMRYCVPMIASCLVALAKKEQIQAYESAILNLGIHSFFHMKYGYRDKDYDFCPSKPELTEMSRNAIAAMTGNSMLVTNQWADIKVVQGDTDALFQYDKYRDVNAELLSAGGISAVIVSGRADDGASFASAQVSIKTAASRIRQARQNFCELMNKVNRRLNGGVLPYGSPDKIPEFTFPPVDLENSTAFLEACTKLWQQGVVSTRTMLEANGYDIGQEVERRKAEAQDETDAVLTPRETKASTTENEPLEMDKNEKGGRPKLNEDERQSDESKAETGKQPKPSRDGKDSLGG